MKKRGLVGWIILGVIVVILLAVVIAGVYFYNFHVFKTVRLCLGEAEDSGFECLVVQDCFDRAEELASEYNVSDLPDFARERIELLRDDAVYCDGTCFVKDIRGIDKENYEIEMLESCEAGEVEIVVDIRGKDGLEILKWMKSQEK